MNDAGVRVLDAGDPLDRAEWLRRWAAWPEREPMAHPAYVSLFARECDRAVCAVAGSATAGVLYPLVLRPIANEPWASAGETLWDAVTPYGYGGPFSVGIGPQDASVFWSQLAPKLRELRIVTSFARLSLFEEQLLPFEGSVAVNMPNVVRRLDIAAEDIWRSYAHKVRKNVNAARRAGLTVQIETDGRRIADFIAIYVGTMDRRNAAEGYYFSREFFECLVRELPGSYLFAHVLSGEKLVSTELVLRSRQHLYSFLGGTLAEAFELRPNDLLKHAVIEWGQREGLSAYVLGGGYGGPDGIFKYKLSFAPDGELPFRVGCAVHDVQAYEELVAARAAFERARGTEWTPREGFFPAYRA